MQMQREAKHLQISTRTWNPSHSLDGRPDDRLCTQITTSPVNLEVDIVLLRGREIATV